MASEQNDAPMPVNTPDEIKTALAYLNGVAKAAAERGNTILWQRRHEQINALLVQLDEIGRLEASFSGTAA